MSTTTVHDPFDLRSDTGLPRIGDALEPAQARRWLGQVLGQPIQLQAIRVVRHKPGKRCLIEYHLADTVVMGKVRAKGLDLKTYYVHEALWQQQFNPQAPDHISVPQPLGVVPELHMTLQRKVSGTPLTTLLSGTDGPALCQRIAQAAHKLHHSRIPTQRYHTLSDELRILQNCLQQVTRAYPAWKTRLEQLFRACQQLALNLPQPELVGIHRDFYPDQVLVDGERLWLLDLDLYCMGDPALDIGNFIGHLSEQALRTSGDSLALDVLEVAVEEEFTRLSGEGVRPATRVYALLTLVRHIWISTRIPARRTITEALLELCEARLSRTLKNPGALTESGSSSRGHGPPYRRSSRE